MILQALTQHYETLVQLGKIEAPGWMPVKVGVALYLDDQGNIIQAISMKQEVVRGKKTVLLPQSIPLPAPVKRTVGVSANFLCDHSGYMLGFDSKGKADRTRECFQSCKALHERLLSGVNSPAAHAICAFFANWNPEAARQHPALERCMDDLLSGDNIIFRYQGMFAHDDPAIRAAWQEHYNASDTQPTAICMVTGKQCVPESVHPSIKGIPGAQTSGAALVSFNAPAFCSYGKEQNLNAPTSKYAAFAYTAVLNYMIADHEHVQRIGDTTVLLWAKSGEEPYQDFLDAFLSDSTYYEENDLHTILQKLCDGHKVEFNECQLDPAMDFYILGISPNAARLSVRFFVHNHFGQFLQNLQNHYKRLEIVRPAFDTVTHLSPTQLLNETVQKNARDKTPSPVLAGELLQAILFGSRYPATLLNSIAIRIRADHTVNRARAAIIKAYYIKNVHPDVPEEVLEVSLNAQSTNIPYTLGRLFSVLEDIQLAANPGIKATIRDKYFNSASATPGAVFPILTNLAQKHLRKLETAHRISYENQLFPLFEILGDEYPVHLTLAQQGSFQIGYYHQTQARYTKKDKED